jgi:ANTAR domain-containing protein
VTLGEGPSHDVLTSAAPVLVEDIEDEEAGRRWPAFTAEAGKPHRAEVDQATGMLTVQLGVTAAEAYARLRAYAYAQDRRLADVAGDIVARRLRLHPDPVQDGPP